MDNSNSLKSASIPADNAPSSERPLTMAQLAKHVGVSASAVSVVLSNTNSRIKVSETTRQRILEAARELNYRPNVVARSLRKQHTNIIGFYKSYGEMISIEYPFASTLVRGILAGCREHKKDLLLYGQVEMSGDNAPSLEMLNGQLDGLVLYASEPNALTQRLVESNLPVVTVADEITGLPCVTVDDELGSRLLVRYLAEKGYRRILYWFDPNQFSSSLVKRQSSYLKEAAHYGLKVEVFNECDPMEPALKMIMARKDRPDVISVYCDEEAHFVIQALNALGFQVPKDVAVTGFDGIPGSHPDLTTIRAPWKQVSHTAVSLLAQRSEKRMIPSQTILPVELLIGKTA
jgi:LacI family transcriptional regulator